MILNYASPFALALILFFVAKLPGTSALFLHTYLFTPSLGSGCCQALLYMLALPRPLLGNEGL